MARNLLITLLLALGLTAWAAPLKNVEVTLTQPDGQVIHCFASGDEFYNYLHDANGFTIVKGDGSYYVYAAKDANGNVVPTSYRVNSVDPAKVGLQPYVKISEKEYHARRYERERHILPPQTKNGKELNHGRYNNLVVFIRFKGDSYHNNAFSTVETMFNGDNYNSNSLHNYYHHTSYNQLDLWSYFYPQPDGETILSYEDIHPKGYYQPYDPVSNPIGYQDGETAEREFSMLERAINYIEDMVPEDLDLDYNNDGQVDNVVFVIKGETGEWASLLWPHRWCIYDRWVPLHDLRVYDFNLQLEQGGYFNVSTLCHEMFHSLGAPDLYHYSDGIDPVGSWDLMCGTTEPPQQTNTYMKYKYGNWVEEIPELNLEEGGIAELEAVSWEGNRRNGYKIATGNPNQFLFVEYRDKSQLFDNHIPGSGLLVYRIDTRFDGNAGWNGYDTYDEVYLFRPGGSIYNAGDLDHAFLSAESGRTEFNSNTDPHPYYTNGQAIDMESIIYNIGRCGDRLTFSYGNYNWGPAPEEFIAHVNKEAHQIELSWHAREGAESYNVYCDGENIALHITDTTFIHPYTDSDHGRHVYRVHSVSGGLLFLPSSPAKAAVILGNYETIRVDLSTDSDYGTKGGELEITFNDPAMEEQYITLYRGSTIETDIQVPANTEVTFTWYPGFDSESHGIHLSVMHLNDQEHGMLFDITDPEEGALAVYTAADAGLGCHNPQHVTATAEGNNIRLTWTMPTENNQFNIFRDGVLQAAAITGYEYLDDQFVRSGTHRYQVESCCGDYFSWNPDKAVYAAAMCYYCEPPQNLQGTHNPTYDLLWWEAPQFSGHGLLAFDDNKCIDSVALSGKKIAIKIEPENLAAFDGLPITHLETFDCTVGTYRFRIYNGDVTNNSTLILTQECALTGSKAMIRFPLETPLAYDQTLPLWITVQPLQDAVVPCCQYVGLDNGSLLSAGNNWIPVSSYGLDYSWILRAYTAAPEGVRDFTYNVYCGPEEGGDEQLTQIFTALPTNDVSNINTENLRYNVTAIWNGRETDLSNTIYLGPSVEVEEHPVVIEDLENMPGTVLQVIDMTGRVIVNLRDVSQTISTEGMTPGVYLFRWINGDRVKTQKIVVR